MTNMRNLLPLLFASALFAKGALYLLLAFGLGLAADLLYRLSRFCEVGGEKVAR
jgi:hypothetical protein